MLMNISTKDEVVFNRKDAGGASCNGRHEYLQIILS